MIKFMDRHAHHKRKDGMMMWKIVFKCVAMVWTIAGMLVFLAGALSVFSRGYGIYRGYILSAVAIAMGLCTFLLLRSIKKDKARRKASLQGQDSPAAGTSQSMAQRDAVSSNRGETSTAKTGIFPGAKMNRSPKKHAAEGEISEGLSRSHGEYAHGTTAVIVSEKQSGNAAEKSGVQAAEADSRQSAPVCKYCGHVYESGDTFCTECGGTETV